MNRYPAIRPRSAAPPSRPATAVLNHYLAFILGLQAACGLLCLLTAP